MMNDQFQTSPRKVSKSGHSRWQKKHALPVKDSALEGNSYQFDQFLEAVKLQMQPEGRALHTAGMLEYLRTLLPNDVTLADLVAGWQSAHERSASHYCHTLLRYIMRTISLALFFVPLILKGQQRAL